MRVKSPGLGLIMAGLISVTTGCVVGPHTKSAQAGKTTTSIHQQISTTSAANLTLATWNMEHLAFPISQGCRPRSETEIQQLQQYAQTVDADIYAVQEVASLAALQQVFPVDQWQIFISDRADSPTYTCRKTGFTSSQQKVAFAVRKGIKVNNVTSVSELGLGMPGLRYGLQLNVSSDLGDMTVLNVHMKSGCFVDDYSRADTEACQILARQVPILDQWIERHEQQGKPYVVLGDFNHRLSAPYNKMTRHLLSNSNGVASTLENTGEKLMGCHPYYPAPIDHIFTGNMTSPTLTKSARMQKFANMQADAMLSDHCALVLELSKQSLPLSNSVKWQTTSKEYQYLTTSIYHQASQVLRNKNLPKTPWTVVMDVDETVLDNSQYQVQTEQAGKSYHPETWRAWVRAEQATLVPGVKDFIQTVFNLGGQLTLITNRDRDLDSYTWNNLLALGLAVSTDNTCLTGRQERDKAAIDGLQIKNDKDLRRQQITEGTASCFSTPDTRKQVGSKATILMQVGDNIEDFSAVTQEEAHIQLLVPLKQQEFILLPNPMYGSW